MWKNFQLVSSTKNRTSWSSVSSHLWVTTRPGWCHHSAVDSSVPSILLPQDRLPSTPSMLLSLIVKFVLYWSLYCEKNENKQKETGFGPFKKLGQVFRPHKTWSLKNSTTFVQESKKSFFVVWNNVLCTETCLSTNCQIEKSPKWILSQKN